jgi:hypothetical protein
VLNSESRKMKRCTALLLGLCLSLAQASTDELNADAREYVSGLRQAMSLKHKIGQMVQLNIDVLLDHDALTLNTTKCVPPLSILHGFPRPRRDESDVPTRTGL